MKKAIGDNMIPKDWGLERGLELVKKAGYDEYYSAALTAMLRQRWSRLWS